MLKRTFSAPTSSKPANPVDARANKVKFEAKAELATAHPMSSEKQFRVKTLNRVLQKRKRRIQKRKRRIKDLKCYIQYLEFRVEDLEHDIREQKETSKTQHEELQRYLSQPSPDMQLVDAVNSYLRMIEGIIAKYMAEMLETEKTLAEYNQELRRACERLFSNICTLERLRMDGYLTGF